MFSVHFSSSISPLVCLTVAREERAAANLPVVKEERAAANPPVAREERAAANPPVREERAVTVDR